jgi:hypothetical protein
MQTATRLRLCAVAVPMCCRPAVILSFLVAGISALLSALCYSEFAAEVTFDQISHVDAVLCASGYNTTQQPGIVAFHS